MSTSGHQHRTGRTAVGVALATVALLLAGCGSSTSSAPAAGASSASMGSSDSMGSMSMGSSPAAGKTGGTSAGASVSIKDFAFVGPSSVAPGAEVTVTNEDSEVHSLTSDGAGGFDVTIDPGASATFTAPTKPGSYPYHCTYHSNMQGTLTVA